MAATKPFMEVRGSVGYVTGPTRLVSVGLLGGAGDAVEINAAVEALVKETKDKCALWIASAFGAYGSKIAAALLANEI